MTFTITLKVCLVHTLNYLQGAHAQAGMFGATRLKAMSAFSHPTAACLEANGLYWKWVHVAEKWDCKYKVFQDAKAEYQLHLIECETCREGIDA